MTTKTFDPYNKDTTIIFKRDDEGLRINGQLVQIKIKNGIVSIDNGTTGTGHSCHPNIDMTGSISGMKKLGHWKEDDEIIKANGYYYNKSKIVISDPLDLLAYLMEYHSYQIKPEVLKQAGNPLWSGIAVTLPKISK